MKEKLKFSVNDGHEHALLEIEEIVIRNSSRIPMASTYPCTKCSCSNFVMKTSIPPSSITCETCGHDSSAHGL